mmetsp:Transcript_22214/g.40027  ORF Transcript_22214/g.40027 Transcript_22214/m.40027 type:complete len:298 (-) Transcript_22214:378-1271(-)
MLVIRQKSWRRTNTIRLRLLADTTQRSNRDINSRSSSSCPRIIMAKELPAANIVQFVGWARRRCRAFSLQLENDHSRIMSSGEEILGPMSCKNPETVAFPAECLHTDTFRDIPNTNTPIFRVRNYKLMLGVEKTTRDIVRVTTKRIHFPSLGLTHSPQFDLPVISGTRKKRKGRVEGCPVHATVMSFKDIFDDNVICSKEFSLNIEGGRVTSPRSATGAAIDRRHAGSSETSVHTSTHLLLSKAGRVPHAHGLIQRCTHDQVLAGVKGGTHNVVIVASQHTKTGPLLKVPKTQSLII